MNEARLCNGKLIEKLLLIVTMVDLKYIYFQKRSQLYTLESLLLFRIKVTVGKVKRYIEGLSLRRYML